MACSHPQYPIEKQKLDHTIAYITQWINDHTPPFSEAADSRTAVEISRVRQQRINALKEARDRPYIGRVDARCVGQPAPEIFYVGYQEIMDEGVYSWMDTLAGKLYYGDLKNSEAQVLLRRDYTIAQDDLEKIQDRYVDPAMIEQYQAVIPQFGDTLLFKLLSETRAGSLRDIVQTIQSEQYEIISAPASQPLVVQGVAGSGKTQIALHRVAYLSYHEKGWQPGDVLILGPTPLFLGYVAEVLPSLGERGIPQYSFDDWALERLGTEIAYQSLEDSLELLLDADTPLEQRIQHVQNARNKGSLAMAELIDRYVNELFEDAVSKLQPLRCVYQPRIGTQREGRSLLVAERDVATLSEAARRVQDQPLNLRREKIEALLSQEISRELGRQVDDPHERKRLEESIQQQVRANFQEWRGLNVLVAYRRLLRDTALLRRLGADLFSERDLEFLALDAPTQTRPFRPCDLAPLLYLKLRLDGPGEARYAHIVVDEAQDLPPLYFRVLAAHSRDGSMTIVGDSEQGIYAHHGLASWDDLGAALGRSPVQRSIRTSYRSTQEIIAYANGLLERVHHRDDLTAIPIARSGPQPALHHVKDFRKLVHQVHDLVVQEQEQGRRTIAIVCKTLAASRKMAEALRGIGLSDCSLLGRRDQRYDGGVVVIPACLTKGLEFDAVIVAGADARSYPPGQISMRLLYVAITRASHSLHICWEGNLTPLLDGSELEVNTLLDACAAPKPVTVAEFARQRSIGDTDELIERLAAAGKLYLLKNGRMDASLLALINARYERERESQEIEIPPLPAGVIDEMQRWISDVMQDDSPDMIAAGAQLQLAYGLLRNHLRSWGLAPDDGEDDALQQAVALSRFLYATRNGLLTPGAGRWTTRARAVEAAEPRFHEHANRILDQFIDYGLIQVDRIGERMQLRVAQEWAAGLAEIALGGSPAEWDRDLCANLPEFPGLWDALAPYWSGTEKPYHD